MEADKLTAVSNRALKVHSWEHIIIRYSKKKVDIFVNGTKTPVDIKSTLKQNFSSYGPLLIGFENFKGSIDDVRFWNKALKEKEVEELYSYRKTPDLQLLVHKYYVLKSKAYTSNNSTTKKQ